MEDDHGVDRREDLRECRDVHALRGILDGERCILTLVTLELTAALRYKSAAKQRLATMAIELRFLVPWYAAYHNPEINYLSINEV